MSSTNNGSSLQTTGAFPLHEQRANDSLDLLLQKLNAMDAKITILRQFLADLETERHEIQQAYEDELRARATADKDRMVDCQDSHREPIMHDPHRQYCDLERMAEMPLVPDAGTVSGSQMLLDPIRMDRQQGKEVREREGERDVRDPKRLKPEQKRNRKPRKGDRPYVKKASRRHTTSPTLGPDMLSSSGVFGGGRPGAAGGVKPVSLSVPGKEQDGGSIPQQGPPRQPQFPGAKSGTPQQPLPQPPTHPFPRRRDVDLLSCPPELKIEGPDWFVLFNPSPKVKRVLDVNLLHALEHGSVVRCAKFSRDGKWVATGCDGTAQIYDVKTGVKTCVLDHRMSTGDMFIRTVCFSPDGKYLATGAEDKQIRIWNIAKRGIRNTFEGHQAVIYTLDFSSDGRFVASGSADATVRIWDLHDGTSKVLTIDDHYSLRRKVRSVSICPDGRYVAVGSADMVVRIWEMSTGVLVQELRGHRDSVFCVAYTPDGKGLVSGSWDETLKYWDVSLLGNVSAAGDGSVGSEREGNGKTASGPDNLALTSPPSSTQFTPSAFSPCIMNITSHNGPVLSVAVSHDGAWVASGSLDQCVQFCDARTGVVQCMLSGYGDGLVSVDLSPAGNLLAMVGGDLRARIWSY